ncbi:MAG: fimbrial protein [Bacteriovorax sp.]|nr:fimbrial protein [Bacteriovorax sp.]
MKKLIAATVLFALNTSSFAATSGTLLLQGIVAQKVSVAVTPVAVASALDLSTTQADLKVGSVNVQSNSKSGYKLTITSANMGKLKRTDGAEVFAYTLKYGGSAVGLSTASGTVFTDSSASIINVNKDLNVSYTGVAAETMIEGTYQDTLTLNIAAN